MGLNSTGSGALQNRFLLFSLAAFGFFLLLILRLWYLQVISTEQYLTLAEKNRIRDIPIAAPRGPIYDRDGKLLVQNRPAFTLSVLRQELENREELFQRLSGYLDVPLEDLNKRFAKSKRFPRYRPFPLAEDIGLDSLERVQENALDLPGILTEVRPIRSYPEGEMAAHLFGYLAEVTEDDLRGEKVEYRLGEYLGKSGLEKNMEHYLRGASGERRVEVDVRGKELRQLTTLDPVPGNRLYLTVQRDLQRAAEAAFGDQAGAAVALDVRTGEVLAMVSRPSYDPAAFARGISGEEWIRLLQDPRHPLQNKAIKGQYPPGSTFKIVTALAALKAGVATPATTFYCDGKFTLGTREYRCWKRQGHGSVNLKKAIRESCDVYFYEVGLKLGIDRIAEMAKSLGLGASLGFLLDGEKGGLVPTQQWKKERFNDRWYNGETVIAAIGQGYVLATPLQLAVMTAAVANGGTVLRPHVIRRVEDLNGNILLETKPEIISSPSLRASDLRQVQQGMVAVVNEDSGTGRASALDSVKVGGKTGTAQVIKQKERIRDEAGIPYRFRDHALFIAFAPADDPHIAVAVVVEHGMHGGSAAAPIARAIFESYFGVTVDPTLVEGEFYGD